MGAYIVRRLILVIPTLFGILLLNFAIVQFTPGGPVERILAELRDPSQGGAEVAAPAGDSTYRGAQGVDPDLIAELEAQFGLDRPWYERFAIMIWNYARFDFGESFYRSATVTELILEKLPVSVSLGLWTTLISYLVSIPLGIAKAVRDGSRFDAATSGIVIAAYAIPSFLFAIMLLVLFAGGSFLQLFPLRGLTSDNFEELSVAGQIADYFWHIALPVTAMMISGFATLTLLTKNSFLEEIRKQYVLTARAKGLSERRVLYGHVFRNAMLIVIAGFPGAFLSIFFTGSIFVETVFSLDGIGLLGFESAISRDYPVVLGTLFLFGLIGLLIKLISDLTYVWIDPRIDFERREG